MTQTETNKNLHWSVKLKEENKRLKAAVDYLRFQMRVTVQSRFDKYRNANDTEGPMAYRKCAGEIGLRLIEAGNVSQEILDGESEWDVETRTMRDANETYENPSRFMHDCPSDDRDAKETKCDRPFIHLNLGVVRCQRTTSLPHVCSL